tara:strand:- start:16335 stop:17042 length:708 start_codon:yes stop_codon:yes gene_type:complete
VGDNIHLKNIHNNEEMVIEIDPSQPSGYAAKLFAPPDSTEAGTPFQDLGDQFDQFTRDWRKDEPVPATHKHGNTTFDLDYDNDGDGDMDVRLVDNLFTIKDVMNAELASEGKPLLERFDVISGYRHPDTAKLLNSTVSISQHNLGKALDIRPIDTNGDIIPTRDVTQLIWQDISGISGLGNYDVDINTHVDVRALDAERNNPAFWDDDGNGKIGSNSGGPDWSPSGSPAPRSPGG